MLDGHLGKTAVSGFMRRTDRYKSGLAELPSHSIASSDTSEERMRRHHQLEPSESSEFIESRDDRPATACITGRFEESREHMSTSCPRSETVLARIQACETDPQCKIIILRGEGRAFCAGGDVVGKL